MLDVGNEFRQKTKDYKIQLSSSKIRKASIHEMRGVVFSELVQNYQNFDCLISNVVITTENIFLRDIDDVVMQRFPGEEREFLGCNTVKTE